MNFYMFKNESNIIKVTFLQKEKITGLWPKYMC